MIAEMRRLALLPLLLSLLCSCGFGSTSTRSATAAPTPAVQLLVGHGFQAPIPAGWTKQTVENNGANGVMYGLTSAPVKLAPVGIVPSGTVAIEISYAPVSVIEKSVSNISTLDGPALVTQLGAIPKDANMTAHSDASTTEVAGTAGGTETISFDYQGQSRTDIDIAVIHGGNVYFIQGESEEPLLDRTQTALTDTIAGWRWLS